MRAAASIDGVARAASSPARRAVDIVYTGLRLGDKLHEDLLATGERSERPFHPLVS
jgi:FlaA1/EpsC-like NDP-sugar epimerase